MESLSKYKTIKNIYHTNKIVNLLNILALDRAGESIFHDTILSIQYYKAIHSKYFTSRSFIVQLLTHDKTLLIGIFQIFTDKYYNVVGCSNKVGTFNTQVRYVWLNNHTIETIKNINTSSIEILYGRGRKSE